MFTADLILLLAMTTTPAVPAAALPAATLAQAGPPGERWLGTPTPPPPAPAPQGGAWRGAPPPPPMETVRPRRGWVWVEGGFDWRGRKYVKRRGHWEREQPGRQWHAGRWDWQGDHYAWVSGNWSEGPAYVPPPSMIVETPPPPPPPAAVAPAPAPRPGYVWIAGANEWRDGRYAWIEGHWEQERSGDNWRAGHWDREGNRHAWHPGGWEHGDRDDHHGDHGDHHGDHDDRHGDHDDHGDHHGDHGDHHSEYDRGPGPRGGVSIAGQIRDQSGRPAAGITVVLAGTSEGRAVTDGDGRYIFGGLAPGSYAVRPNDPRCNFGPDVMNLNNLGAPAVQNFNANCR